MTPRRRWLALLLALLLPGPARAAVVTVTKTADTSDGICDDDCSLREAILSVIGQPGSTIQLPAGTYRLTIPRGVRGNNAPGPGTRGNLVVGSVLSIAGAGRDVTVLDARPTAKSPSSCSQVATTTTPWVLVVP